MGQAVRTLYDGKGFEVIREGVTFKDGQFTTRYAPGGLEAMGSGATVSNKATGDWNGTTTVTETKSFNGLGIFDRQDKNLRNYLQDAVKYKKAKKEN
jgi:hypothetical protein